MMVDGFRFLIEIYRVGSEKTWILEVVDPEGNSHLWDDPFEFEADAHAEAVEALETEGAIAFMRGSNVAPLLWNS